MKFSKQITINSSVEKVWDVLGRDFANIGVWSTAVSSSVANNEVARVNNSPVGGRLCETSIGKISEEFTAYDDDKKTFSFKVHLVPRCLKVLQIQWSWNQLMKIRR